MKPLPAVFSLSIIFLLSVVCPAQNAARQNFEPVKKEKPANILNNSVEVKANLSISDSTGKPADDIKIEDLQIFEDDVEQKITYLVKKEPVLNVGLAVDNTGSVRKILDRVRLAGEGVVDGLRPTDEAFLVRFVNSDKIEITQDWTSDKAELKDALKNMYIEGGQTAIIDAVYLTAGRLLEREKLDKSKRYAIILISDGVDSDSYYTLDQMLKLFKSTDLQIFQISFPDKEALKNAKKNATPDQNPSSLNNLLALKTGGAAYNLSENFSAEEIGGALKNIARELQSNYIIGYVSTNQKRNGLPRKLRVEITGDKQSEKLQTFIRDGFIVPKNR